MICEEDGSSSNSEEKQKEEKKIDDKFKNISFILICISLCCQNKFI